MFTTDYLLIIHPACNKFWLDGGSDFPVCWSGDWASHTPKLRARCFPRGWRSLEPSFLSLSSFSWLWDCSMPLRFKFKFKMLDYLDQQMREKKSYVTCNEWSHLLTTLIPFLLNFANEELGQICFETVLCGLWLNVNQGLLRLYLSLFLFFLWIAISEVIRRDSMISINKYRIRSLEVRPYST